MAVKRETLEYRKAHNLCPRDGRPNKSGKALCEYCLKKAAEKTERYRQRKIKNGLCTNCGKNQPISSSRLCSECKDKASVYLHNAHIKRYSYRKEMNQCTVCGDEAVSGKTACQSCLNKNAFVQRIKHDKNERDGQCWQCGGDLGNSTGKRCQICKDKRDNWYQGSSTQAKDKIRRDNDRKAVFQHYGGKCICCGEDEPCFLAIDHIGGDGNTHRKEIKKYGSGFFKWIVDNDFPDTLQILCHNCNMGKHLNGGICPHKNNDDNYTPVPPNQTHTVKTRYKYEGKGEPTEFVLDDD